MMPALRPGDILFMAYAPTYKRGQIVLFTHENNSYLKRIIGLPNEHLAINQGRVTIDGVALSEPYVPELANLEPQKNINLHVPDGKYFVAGDTRDDSLDSRRFGPISQIAIRAVARWRCWPPKFRL